MRRMIVVEVWVCLAWLRLLCVVSEVISYD
jgi:hypothetical protein